MSSESYRQYKLPGVFLQPLLQQTLLQIVVHKLHQPLNYYLSLLLQTISTLDTSYVCMTEYHGRGIRSLTIKQRAVSRAVRIIQWAERILPGTPPLGQEHTFCYKLMSVSTWECRRTLRRRATSYRKHQSRGNLKESDNWQKTSLHIDHRRKKLK